MMNLFISSIRTLISSLFLSVSTLLWSRTSLRALDATETFISFSKSHFFPLKKSKRKEQKAETAAWQRYLVSVGRDSSFPLAGVIFKFGKLLS
jgi:hypothetical protein